VEDCPGLVSLASPVACNVQMAFTMPIEVRNDRASDVGAHFYFGSDGGPCARNNDSEAFPRGQVRTANVKQGSTINFFETSTGTVFRTVRLPMQGTCRILLAP